MQCNILGKRYDLQFVRLTSHRGDCDSPDNRGKKIRVDSSLAGEERLEVLLHEMLHAAYWHLDEEYVARFAADAARVLWKLGYKCESES